MEIFSGHRVTKKLGLTLLHFNIFRNRNLLFEDRSQFIYPSLFAKGIMSWLIFRNFWCYDSKLILNFLLLTKRDGPSLLRYRYKLVLVQILVVIKIVKNLVHNVLRLLLTYFYYRFLWLHGILLFFYRVVVHEGINCLVVFSEFALFFAVTTIKSIIVYVPDLPTIIFIAVSLIINNKVIVSAVVLSAFILLGINVLKNFSLFFNLKNNAKKITSYWSVLFKLPCRASFNLESADIF